MQHVQLHFQGKLQRIVREDVHVIGPSHRLLNSGPAGPSCFSSRAVLRQGSTGRPGPPPSIAKVRKSPTSGPGQGRFGRCFEAESAALAAPQVVAATARPASAREAINLFESTASAPNAGLGAKKGGNGGNGRGGGIKWIDNF
jgi:hypothetical protein